MNFMNVGKKRDELIEKLATLIPEMDRFHSEVDKVSDIYLIFPKVFTMPITHTDMLVSSCTMRGKLPEKIK